jgi:hypothetical protein
MHRLPPIRAERFHGGCAPVALNGQARDHERLVGGELRDDELELARWENEGGLVRERSLIRPWAHHA